MNYFLLLLALRLALSDKLDRTYLPPPGSKYAGGSEGAIDVPLEYPKESYTTTGRPIQNQKEFQPDDTQPTIGINRGEGIGPGTQDFTSITQVPQRPLTFLQNKFKVPTTTTSYAFTQTTTYPPSEGYETTLSPTGLPYFDGQQFIGTDAGNYPQSIPGQQTFPGQIKDQQSSFIQRPGVRPSIQRLQIVPGRPGSQTQFIPPGYLPTSQQPGLSQEGYIPSVTQGQIAGQSGSQLVPSYQNIPGFQGTPSYVPQQGQQEFSKPPSVYNPQSGVVTIGSQISDFILQPSVQTGSPFQGQQNYLPQYENKTITQQKYGPNKPGMTSTVFSTPGSYTGVQPPIDQQAFVSTTVSPQGFYQQTSKAQRPQISYQQQFDQIPSSAPSTAIPPQYRPETLYTTDLQENIQPGSVLRPNQQSFQIPGSQSFSTTPSPFDFSSTQTSVPQYGFDNIQGISPQQFGYQRPMQGTGGQGNFLPRPTSQYKPGFEEPVSDINSSLQLGQNQNQNIDGQLPQQYGTTSRPDATQNVQNIFSQQSMVSPVGTAYPSKPFPSTTPSSGLYGTTPSGTYSPTTPGSYQEASAQASVGPQQLIPRAERPQAESDRNAVIFNYENVLTPEGYSYSFDTSNGIHADESATAIGGVRALGSYSYIGDDGKEYSVIYSADENGFLPKGDHLPTPPPIPEAIQRVIEQALKDKKAGIYHDGSYDDSKYGHQKYQRPKYSRLKPNIVNGVDIPKDFEDDKENMRPGQQSYLEPNFDQDNSFNQDENVGNKVFSNGTQKPNIKNKIPSDSKPFRKPLSDEYIEQNVAVDEYGNVIPITETSMKTTSSKNKYKENNKGIPSQKPEIPRRKPTGSSFIDSNPAEEDKNNDYALIEPDNESQPLPGKPGMVPSQYLPKIQKQKNSKGQTVIQRPELTTSSYGVSFSDDGTEGNLDDKNMRGLGTKTKSGILKMSKQPGRDSYVEMYESQTPEGYSRKIQKQKGLKQPGSTANTYSEVYETQTPEVLLPEGEEYTDDEINNKVLKGNGKPPSSSMSSNTFLGSQKAETGTGYQYIPPKNKLTIGEKNKFPTRFPEFQDVTTQPDFIKTFDKTSTAKPFMTPNVFRNDEESYDDYESNLPPKKPSKVLYDSTKSTVTEDEYSDYPQTEIDNNLFLNKTYQIMPSTARPGRPDDTKISPQRRPTYTTQSTTGQPTYEDTYTVPIEATKTRPYQSAIDQYINGQGPVEDLSQMFGQKLANASRKPGSKYYFTTTRPVTSTLPTYEVENTSEIVTPGAYEEETITINQRPGFRKITQRPYSRLGGRPATTSPGVTMYQTDESVTESIENESTELEPDMVRSGVSKAPFTVPTTGSTDDFTSTLRPDFTTSRPSFYDKTTLSSSTGGPSSRIPSKSEIRFQDVSSTTYRPNYPLSDNQQPSNVSVDGFGRPLPSDTNEQYSTPASIPNYSIPTSSLPPADYLDSIKPGQISRKNETFNPNEQRFGQNDDQTQKLLEGNRDIFRPENQRPFETQNQMLFSHQTPGSLDAQNLNKFGDQNPNRQYGTSQSTTEKVYGEDFSGPKQPQRFDPKYGYYY